MKRVWAVLGAASAALALMSPVKASADPPQPPEPASFVLPGTDTDGIDGYCPFSVKLTVLVNNEHSRTRTRPNGEVVQTYQGHLVASVQNVDTGKTITYNSSGPGVVTTHADGSYTVNTHGGNLFFTTVRNTYPGPPTVPPIYYSTGHLVFTISGGTLNDNSAPTVAWSLRGRLTDVCRQLAG